jgi:hypothetical protein
MGTSQFECPEKKKETGGEAHIAEAQRRDVEIEYAEGGRSLVMRKVLLTPEKEMENPAQRNNLFRTACKTKDRVHARSLWTVEAPIISFQPRW